MNDTSQTRLIEESRPIDMSEDELEAQASSQQEVNHRRQVRWRNALALAPVPGFIVSFLLLVSLIEKQVALTLSASLAMALAAVGSLSTAWGNKDTMGAFRLSVLFIVIASIAASVALWMGHVEGGGEAGFMLLRDWFLVVLVASTTWILALATGVFAVSCRRREPHLLVYLGYLPLIFFGHNLMSGFFN